MLASHFSKIFLTVALLFGIKTDIDSAEAASGGVLTNKAFQNFDLKCLPSETISGLVYKKFVSANGTADLELSLFCRSITGPGDPALVVDESNCRYSEKFRLQNNSTAAIANSDCQRDEYISGFLGTFEKSIRVLRLRCCKAINAHQDDAIECRTVGPEGMAAVAVTGLRDPTPPKSGCPRNVFSSFSIARGKLTVKFCALAVDGAKYESYCYPDPQRDNSQDNLPATSGCKSTSNNNERPSRNFENVPPRRFGRLQPVDPGEGTKYGQPFQIECRAPNEAFSRMEVQLVSGPDGNDLLFNFSCTPVTGESQRAIRKRVTNFVRLNDTDAVSCKDNETLCGFYGSYNRSRHTKRRYAFGCCEGSNWYATTASQNETEKVVGALAGMALVAADGAGAGDKKLQDISFSMSDQEAMITAVFFSYEGLARPRFTKSSTVYET